MDKRKHITRPWLAEARRKSAQTNRERLKDPKVKAETVARLLAGQKAYREKVKRGLQALEGNNYKKVKYTIDNVL